MTAYLLFNNDKMRAFAVLSLYITRIWVFGDTRDEQPELFFIATFYFMLSKIVHTHRDALGS